MRERPQTKSFQETGLQQRDRWVNQSNDTLNGWCDQIIGEYYLPCLVDAVGDTAVLDSLSQNNSTVNGADALTFFTPDSRNDGRHGDVIGSKKTRAEA